MSDFPKFSDLFRTARDEAMTRNALLTRQTVERDGTDANVMLAGGAAVGDEVVGQLIQVEAGLYLDSAKKTKLDRLVFDRYGLVRKPAAAAVGEVDFSTTVNNPSPFSISVGTLVKTNGGVQYVTTATTLFPSATTGPITIPVRSVLAGLNQQAAIGTITTIATAITGAPSDLAVDNSLATAGADDAEDDDSLRARARTFFTTARRGTLNAIQAGGLAVAGIRRATAFETLDAVGHPGRSVQLVVADAYTDTLASLSPTPGAYQAQSQALAISVFTSLDDVRAGGINVTVYVASVVMLPIVLRLSFLASADPDLVTEMAQAATVGYVNGLSPGETFSAQDLRTRLQGIPGLFITGNEVASPAGNVVPQTLQVLRTTLALVSPA